jgi:hypothetical protein
MFTAPWAHQLPDARGNPGHEPDAECADGKGEMEEVVLARADKRVFVAALVAIGTDVVAPRRVTVPPAFSLRPRFFTRTIVFTPRHGCQCSSGRHNNQHGPALMVSPMILAAKTGALLRRGNILLTFPRRCGYLEACSDSV